MQDALSRKDPRMRAVVFHKVGQPLSLERVKIPRPDPGQVLIRVTACAVCRTDLHVVDGDLEEPKIPLIPGHEIVGEVVELGEGVDTVSLEDRVGVPWLGWTCGECRYCREGQENLCPKARFTGYNIDGGYAEYTVADARFCLPIPDSYQDFEAAPLLCAGLIGQRSLDMAGDARRLGLYGFGAAAHIVAQVAIYQGRQIFAFTRPGDSQAQSFATRLGAVWAGGSDQDPPEPLDAAILFAPVGELVPLALKATRPGGVVVCGGIHMSPIPSFPYRLLWGERSLRSVANLTRRDGLRFLDIAPRVPVKTETKLYGIEQAPQALDDLREGRLEGAAVLTL